MLNLIAPTLSKACLAFYCFVQDIHLEETFASLKRLKVFWKFVLMKSENMSPLNLTSYCSHKTTPFWSAIARMKCATLPLESILDPLAVQLGCKPSFFNCHALVCIDRVSHEGCT